MACMEARQALGWSRADLAATVGIRELLVAEFERGAAYLDINDLVAIKATLEAAGAHFRDSPPVITAHQSMGARAMLGWSRKMLARRAGVAERTLSDFERQARRPHSNNLAAIAGALESAGIEFIAENGGGPGVRLRHGLALQV